MRVKAIVDEWFQDYKKPSMFIATCFCDFKCCHDANIPISVCQNHTLFEKQIIDVPAEDIIRRYTSNNLTQAVVIGGLEPMLQFNELMEFIVAFRSKGIDDDIVVYTGYREDEVVKEIVAMSFYPNIVVKFGRYIPDRKQHYDSILGVSLANDEQFAKRIS